MAVAFGTAGTVGVGSTSITPGLPASLTDGDVVWIVVVSKPDTTTHVTPTDWSLAGSAAGGGGTSGNGTGPTRVSVMFRVKDASWSTMPAITCTGGNSTAAQAFRYTRDTSKTLDVASAGGAFSGNTTAWSATMASDPGVTAGDLVLLASSTQDEAPTWSAETFTATGLTLGTATERSEAIEGTTGNDVGGWMADRPVTAGTATAPAVVTATSSVASRGATLLVRVREVVSALTLTSLSTATSRGLATSDTATLRTKANVARAVGAASSDTATVRPKIATARAVARASSDSAGVRVTTGRAVSHASAKATTVIAKQSTGVGVAAALADANTTTTRVSTDAAIGHTHTTGQTTTARATDAAATATASAVGGSATQRTADSAATATASARATVTTVRITLAAAIAHALATGVAEGGTGTPPEMHQTTGTALAWAAAEAATQTLRATTGTAAAHALARSTASQPGQPSAAARPRLLTARPLPSNLRITPVRRPS